MRVLLLGNGALADPLAAAGCEVVFGADVRPDLFVMGVPFDVRELWQALPAAPDALLFADSLAFDALPWGLEHVPVPRLYWAIDSHLNLFWQRHYARLFDAVFVAQRDDAHALAADGLPARWLPWGAPAAFRAPAGERPRDVVFAGTLDVATRPKRAAAVALLRERCGIEVFGASVDTRLPADEMARVFGQAKIVFNEAICGELNFRVFEAMACGALLVTEAGAQGLDDLFTPGEHLVTYRPETLCDTVVRWLAADAARARVAAAGAALVDGRHRLRHRVEVLRDAIAAGVPRRDVAAGAAAAFGLTAWLTTLTGRTRADRGLPVAATQLSQAALHEGDGEAALALGELMAVTGRATAALEALALARRLLPHDVRAWALAAEVEKRRGGTAEAARLLREIGAGGEAPAALAGVGRALAAARMVAWRGCVPRLAGALPRCALDYLAAAVQADPTNVGAAEDAADHLEHLHLPDLAVPFRRHVVAQTPDDGAARTRLRRTLVRCFRLAEADALGA